MKPNEAKKVVRGWLDQAGAADYHLTAKTEGFLDLARDQMVFVTVYGWLGPGWMDMRAKARALGFRVELG